MHPSRLRLGPSQSRPLTDASPGSARSPGLRVCWAAPSRRRNIHTHAPFRTECHSFLRCRGTRLTISRNQRSGHAAALRRQRPQVRILSGAPMISRSYAKAAGGAGTSWLPGGHRNTACEAINPPPIEHADLFASPGSIPFCPQLWVAQAGLAQLRPRPSKTTRTIASRHRLDSRARQVDTSETAVLSKTALLVGRRSDLSTFPVSYLGVRGSSPLRDTIISIT
jgi:hypothetical protein